MQKSIRIGSLLLGLICLLAGCGGGKDEGDGVPAGENAMLREVVYTSRNYGEKESKDVLLRKVRFSFIEDGGILRESFDGEESLYEKDWYTSEGDLLRSENYSYGEDGTLSETDAVVYTLEGGLCVKEETFENGSRVLSYTREFDERGNLSYEQLYRIREGTPELQYTHHFESSYDEDGNLVEQIYTCDEEPTQNTHFRYTYDEQGRLTKEAEIRYGREYTVILYTLDEYGNICLEQRSEDGNLQSSSEYRYTYDGEGRVLQKDSPSSSVSVTYTYDEKGRCVESVNSSNGKKMTSTAFAYEDSGSLPLRLIQTSLSYTDSEPSGQIYTTIYRYEGETTPALAALLLTLAE